jgi:C-terminal processing protease CtpA/Prc
MYIWYYACADQKNGPTVGRWATAALETIDLDRPDRVIIDLRQNTGGNSALLDPFINLLAKRRKALPGGVYALIGPRTFSSALLNAEKLKLVAGAVLVGSPTGGSPNHFGEVRHFTLPHSGLKVFYSTKRFGLPPGADAPDTLQPDVVVATSSTAYFAGQDPVLEAALSVKP